MKNEEAYDVALVLITFSRLFRDLAEGLSKRGLRVLVVAPNRSYGNADVTFESERITDNLVVERVKVPKFDKNKIFGKLLLYCLFSMRMKRVLREKKILLYSAPLTPFLVPYKVMKLSMRSMKPFLFILEDLVPDAWVRRKRFSEKHPFIKLLKKQTKALLSDSRKVIVIGRDMMDYVKRVYSVPQERLVFIPNWASSTDIPVLTGDGETFEVLYGGNLGEAQKLEVLIEATRLLRIKNIDVQMSFFGDGMRKEHLQEVAHKYDLDNVRFMDYVPEDRFRELTAKASVLVVSLREESKGMSVPSKLYTYLSSGKPILAIVPSGSEIDLAIKEDGFGISVPGETAEAVANAIIRLKEDREFAEQAGENALRAFRTKYNESVAIEKYYSVVTELIGKTEKGESNV